MAGGSVLDLHEAVFATLGVTEARILRCYTPGEPQDLGPWEAALKGRMLSWSVRGWAVGPWPTGHSLSQILDQQRLFLNGDDAWIFWAPATDLRVWTGPKGAVGFPESTNPHVHPRLWTRDGKVRLWEGPLVSLGGLRDFYRTSLRLLETLPPQGLGLKGIHRQAVLEPPLALGSGIRAASRSQIGPLVHLATGSRLDHGSRVSRSLILTPTHLAAEQEIRDRIVIGDQQVDPSDGQVFPLHPSPEYLR